MSLPCPSCPDPLACAHSGCENVCVTCAPTGECQRPDACALDGVPEPPPDAGDLALQALRSHDRWCGHKADSPGDPIAHRAIEALEARQVSGAETVLQEAQRLIYGDRAAAYGPATREAEKVAAGWGVILGLEKIELHHVALCMAWLKIVRETNAHARDNLVDLAGYAGLAEKVIEGR